MEWMYSVDFGGGEKSTKYGKDAMGDRQSLAVQEWIEGERGDERVTLRLGCIALVCFSYAYCAYLCLYRAC